MVIPAALLDANVLIPFEPRDTLLRAAAHGVFTVHWTEHILAEVERNLVANVLRGDPVERSRKAARMLAALRAAFPGALITGYERHIPLMTNDPADRHLTAAATQAEVETIVTFNLRHFPPAALAPLGLRAVHPDAFLIDLLHRTPDAFVSVLAEQVRMRERPRQSPEEVLDIVARLAPQFAMAMRQHLFGKRVSNEHDQSS